MTLFSRDRSFGEPFFIRFNVFLGDAAFALFEIAILASDGSGFSMFVSGRTKSIRIEVIKTAEELKFKAKKQVSLSAELPQQLVQSRLWLCIAEKGTK